MDNAPWPFRRQSAGLPRGRRSQKLTWINSVVVPYGEHALRVLNAIQETKAVGIGLLALLAFSPTGLVSGHRGNPLERFDDPVKLSFTSQPEQAPQ